MNEVTIVIKGKDEASATLNNATKSAGGLGSALGGVAKIAGGIILSEGLQKLPEILMGGISAATGLGEATLKLQHIIGGTSEQSSDMLFAFKELGIDADQAGTMLARFEKNMFAVQIAEDTGGDATKTTSYLLNALGINVLDLNGKLKSTPDLIMELSDRFSKLPDGGEKAAAAIALFGRSGAAMIPFLDLGPKKLQELYDTAKNLGLELSGENVNQIHEYTLAHRQMNEAIGGVKLMIGEALMPVLIRLSNWFVSVQPDIRSFVAAVGTDLKKAFDAVMIVGQPLLDLLGKMSNRDYAVIALGLAAAIGGALATAFWILAGAAMAAWVAENLALFGIPALVTLAIVALALLVDHWNAVWHALQSAPAALLNWLKANWTDVLITFLVPGGLIIEVVKHWSDIWGALPNVVKAKMIDIVNAVRGPINDIIDLFNRMATEAAKPLNWLLEQADKVTRQDWHINVPQASELGEIFDYRGQGGSEADVMGSHNTEITSPIKKATQELEDYGAGVGGAGAASAAAAPQISEAEKNFLALRDALAALNMTAPQFIRFMDLQTSAAKILGLTIGDLGEMYRASGLSVDDWDARMAAVVSLNQMKEQADAATASVNGLYSAMDALLSRNTVESAASKLKEDQLKLQRDQIVADAGGHISTADQKKIDKLNKEIAQIDQSNTVRQDEFNIQKDLLAVHDASLPTDQQLLATSNLYISAMAVQSFNAVTLGNTYYWSQLKLIDWTNQLGIWQAAQQTKNSPSGQAAIDLWNTMTPLEQQYVEGLPHFSNGGIMQTTGLAHLEAGEVVTKPGQKVGTIINNYGRVTNNFPAGDPNTAQQLDKLFRGA